MTKKLKGFVVSHFHHDPVYFKDFQELKMILVDNMDAVLRILDSNQEYKYFTLESVLLLDDYFEIRPENKERVFQYIRSGRILLHPVAVLMDWYLPRGRGEVLIRNLLLAVKKAKEWNLPLTNVFYSPDSFSHNPILIPILNEFGIDSLVFFRGMTEEAVDLNTEFYWWDEKDNNSYLLAVWLMLSYVSGFNLPTDKEQLRKRLDLVIRALGHKISIPAILLMNGQDWFAPPQEDVVSAIKVANQEFKDIQLFHSNLLEYIEEVKRKSPYLAAFKGELRGNRYWWGFPGVFSSRIYLKQKNHESQILLERQAEPLSALAWTLGEVWPEAFLDLAWKYIVENQHHDAITGTHPDRASEDIMAKFRWSRRISKELLNRSLTGISAKIDTQKREGIPLVVYNSEDQKRINLVRTKVKLPGHIAGKPLIIEDCRGRYIPHQVHGQAELQERDVEFKPHQVTYTNLSFMAAVPSYGYSVYWVRENTANPFEFLTNLKAGNNYLENKYFRVEVAKNGSLNILDKMTGRVLKNQNILEDGGDIGDAYSYSPPNNDKIINSRRSKARITLVEKEKGPISATLKVELALHLPESATKDRQSRSSKKVKCPVVYYVSLHKDVPMILIKLNLDNKVEDHRLRVLFPAGMRTDYSLAENYFRVTQRSVEVPDKRRKDIADKNMEEYLSKRYPVGGALPLDKDLGWVEDFSGTHPQGSFVDINDGYTGLAIANKGLPEYEILSRNGENIITLTLLRAVRRIKQSNLTNRRGFTVDELPWLEFFPEEPNFQCPGEHAFEYAIIPHQGDWLESKVYQQAHQFENPLIAWQDSRHAGELLSEMSFVSIEPDTLVITAIKKAEDEDSLIIRFYNIADERVAGSLRFYRKIKRAFRCNMKEENLGELPVNSGGQEIALKVGKAKIITWKIYF